MRRVLTLLSPGMKASRATQRKALTDLLSTNRRHMLVGWGVGGGGGYGDMNNGLKLTPQVKQACCLGIFYLLLGLGATFTVLEAPQIPLCVNKKPKTNPKTLFYPSLKHIFMNVSQYDDFFLLICLQKLTDKLPNYSAKSLLSLLWRKASSSH